MRVGARSLRGAMGTYAVVGAAAVVALAVVLWIGGPEPPAATVVLPAGGPWNGAVLDDGASLRTLSPEGALTVPPGRYRVTLLAADGRSEQREMELPAGETALR